MQFLETLGKMFQESTDWHSSSLSSHQTDWIVIASCDMYFGYRFPHKTDRKILFMLENERFIVCLRKRSDTLQRTFGRPCVSRHGKKSKSAHCYLRCPFPQGPLIFVIKSMSRVVSTRSKAEWFWSKYCLGRENGITACMLLAKITWSCCKVNSSKLKSIHLLDMYLGMEKAV